MKNRKMIPMALIILGIASGPAASYRWSTTDALIQDVWPEADTIKWKRSEGSKHNSSQTSNPPKATVEAEDDDTLVFEGTYFKPDEVPPPPKFMVAHSNWRGTTGPVKLSKSNHNTHHSPSNLYTWSTKKEKNFSSDKFADKSAKGDHHHADIHGENFTTPHLQSTDLYLSSVLLNFSSAVEQSESQQLHQELHDAPYCFTPTETPGRCLSFKKCFPVVFNLIDGNLRNPGLGKLLYQASGPCNASLELDFATEKLVDDKKFHSVQFYNQTICCPGFKHPPSLSEKWKGDSEEEYEVSPKLDSSSHPNPTSSESVQRATISSSETSRSESVVNEFQKALAQRVDGRTVEIKEGDSDEIESMEDSDVGKSDAVQVTNDNATTEGIITMKEILGTNNRSEKERQSGITLSSPTCRNQHEMPRGHWPWMVALLISSRHVCSGALIDQKHVITAANCVDQLNDREVRKIRIILGDRIMYSTTDGPHFWRKVNKVIMHLNYNHSTLANDIAILKMNSAVPLSKNIQPISLLETTSNHQYAKQYKHIKAIAAGWAGANIGQLSFEARPEAETVVNIINTQECRLAYGSFATNGLPQNTLCAMAANNECVADSGGPLVTKTKECWHLIGIMSWGLGCSHFPEVYTDVTQYVSWIQKQVNLNS